MRMINNKIYLFGRIVAIPDFDQPISAGSV